MPSLLTLPRELRDLIYEYYLRCDGGYIYHAESRRMTQTNGNAVCHALALTCRQTASELEGLAFNLNTITFSATYSESLHEQAALHHAVVLMLKTSKRGLLEQIAPKLFTLEMAQRASEAYPQFAGLIDTWVTQNDMRSLWGYNNTFGEAASIWDDFVEYILDLVSEHPAYTETVKAIPSGLGGVEEGRDALQLKDLRLQPWLVVGLSDLKRMSNVILSTSGTPRYYKKTRYSYSAAALALQFLASLSETIRLSVRKIVLEEDHVSVARPESHGRGFISVCQQNRRLQVERRVHLWTTVFPVRLSERSRYIGGAEHDMDSSGVQGDHLLAVDVTRSVGSWIIEAMMLPTLGMPDGSYSLVLDGNPLPEHTSKIFRILQRDASWRIAMDTLHAKGHFADTSWLRRRRHPGFLYRDLPHVIRTLSAEASPIRCNFNPGPLFDVEDLLKDRYWWSLKDWERDWPRHEVREFQTEKPLPPWHVLHWKRVLPGASI